MTFPVTITYQVLITYPITTWLIAWLCCYGLENIFDSWPTSDIKLPPRWWNKTSYLYRLILENIFDSWPVLNLPPCKQNIYKKLHFLFHPVNPQTWSIFFLNFLHIYQQKSTIRILNMIRFRPMTHLDSTYNQNP